MEQNDIKLHESEDLTDNPTGGGQMVAAVIQSGQVNNLFVKASRIDEVSGDLSIKKAFMSVDTPDTDVLYGSHIILSRGTDNPNVNILMMTRNDPFDRRTEAAEYVESFLIRSVVSDMRLFGLQQKDSRILLALQREGSKTPNVGEVFELVFDEGLASEYSQFVRIEDVAVEVVDFTAATMRQLTITLTDPLLYDFPGGQPAANHAAAQAADQVKVLRTEYNPTAKYYGVSDLSEDATALDGFVRINGLYQQIVPSNRSEIALSNQPLGGQATIYYPLAQITVDIATTAGNLSDFISDTLTYSFGRPFTRGTVRLEFSGNAQDYWMDDGAGLLVKNGGSETMTIDYEQGQIANPSAHDHAITLLRLAAQPAVAITDKAYTDSLEITEANQAFTYIKTLIPSPFPESLTVEYMAGGQWYKLTTDHAGNIKGVIDSTGTGTLNTVTDTVQITLPVFPDVGSAIIYSSGGQQHYAEWSGDQNIEIPAVHGTLSNACQPSSLTATWFSDGVAKTATDNGAGLITGDATGRIIYATGQYVLYPYDLPDSATNIVFDYDIANTQTEIFSAVTADGSGNINLTLTNLPVKPGSIEVSFNTDYAKQVVKGETTVVSGLYNWYMGNTPSITTELEYTKFLGYSTLTEKSQLLHHLLDQLISGDNGEFPTRAGSSIVYSTGVLSFKAATVIPSRDYQPAPEDKNWYDSETESDTYVDTDITVTYIQDTGTPTTTQDVVAVPPLKLRAAPTTTYQLVPNALMFELAGDIYTDKNGLLYQNGSTLAGSIDYQAAEATLDVWSGAPANFNVLNMLVQYGDWTEYDFIFRTNAVPLLNQSFYLQANAAGNGAQIFDDADASGVLSAALLAGTIDIITGIAKAKFGEYVVAAGNESEPWYSVEELDGNGNVWKPEPIDLNSAFYNAVAYSYIPVSADKLGIDPVRLPADGRVQVFDIGDEVVLQDTASEQIGTATPGSVHTLTGTGFTHIELHDKDGLVLPTTLYTVDYDAVTVTMADPLDLTGFAEPLVAKKIIEDMLLISDIDITGKISFASNPAHDYPAETTRICNALTHGDLGARVDFLFNQEVWTGEWSDTLIGDESTAKYNDTLYPVQLENDSAITEDWAIRYVDTSNVEVIGQESGNLGVFPIASNVAPINPVAGKAYFTLIAAGFGAGGAANNVIRMKTIAASGPTWFLKSTLPGGQPTDGDSFYVQMRGDYLSQL